MRRFVSMTTIAGLMFSLVSPLLATTCEHGQMTACRRVQAQKPHCEMMHEQDAAEKQEADAPEEGSASGGLAVHAAPASPGCPMDCCQLGDRSNTIVLVVTPALPQPVIAEYSSSAVPVVFSSTGFSSHTDRGPPSA